MYKHRKMAWTAVILILLLAMACSFGAKKDTPEPVSPQESTTILETTVDVEEMIPMLEQTPEIKPPPQGEDSATSNDSPFPLSDDAVNITSSADSVNFQTGMTMNNAIDHYRSVFTSQGLIENDLLTSITDATFSMVFEGSANGRLLVIQGVDLGNGSTNINIRYED